MKKSGTNALAAFNAVVDWNVTVHLERHADVAHAHTS
jgi:hypothetical protein